MALILFGLVLRCAERVRGRPAARLSYWTFGVIPPLAFTLQEHLERLFHDGTFPWTAILEPTFGLGLLLTLPAGLLALLVARTLLAVADEIGAALGAGLAAQVQPPPARAICSSPPELPRVPVLARGHGVRGPPLVAPS